MRSRPARPLTTASALTCCVFLSHPPLFRRKAYTGNIPAAKAGSTMYDTPAQSMRSLVSKICAGQRPVYPQLPHESPSLIVTTLFVGRTESSRKRRKISLQYPDVESRRHSGADAQGARLSSALWHPQAHPCFFGRSVQPRHQRARALIDQWHHAG